MSVAASSPAWLTRRADERKSRWACVRGLRRLVVPVEDDGDGDGADDEAEWWVVSVVDLVCELCMVLAWSVISAGRDGEVESSRRGGVVLAVWRKNAGARKSWTGSCRDAARLR